MATTNKVAPRTNDVGTTAPDHRVAKAHTEPKKGSHAVIVDPGPPVRKGA